MELTFDILKDDIEEHYSALWKESGKTSITWQIVNIIVWAVIAFVYLSFFGLINKSHIVLFFLVLAATSISEILRTRQVR